MHSILITLLAAVGTGISSEDAASGGPDYGIVVSEATAGDASWSTVVTALSAEHQAAVLTYEQVPEESLPELRKLFPRYVCFVARPAEAGREFVARVNRLVRRLDDDPYTDARWGILTGYDAGDALRIAQHREPLLIRRVAAGTEIALSVCEEGRWYSELTPGRMVRKDPGEAPKTVQVPADTTKALVDALNVYEAQLFVTSGHATERDWQIGYGYQNGQFRSRAGQLFGVDLEGRSWPVRSDNPKVYLPVGNCLMGHIDGPDAMALAWIHSAGVYQMAGYTVPTWYGYAGWGLLDYFVEQPGRYTLAEAFLANQHALVHRLATFFPGLETLEDGLAPVLPHGSPSQAALAAGLSWQDARGLLYDRDTVAFYGDPAWEARIAPGETGWEQSLSVTDGEYRFDVRPLRGEESFQPLNRNGSQRGGRPLIAFLPHRIRPNSVNITEGRRFHPLVTDDFILVPNSAAREVGGPFRVVFRAVPAED
ncbi:MAG: hypothetical protein Kow0040_26860 [Thermogutta sp.]